MSIDCFRDELLSLKDAANSLPGRPHVLTVHRWAVKGLRGHLLETVVIGNQRYTTKQALNEFFAATAAPVDGYFRPKSKPKPKNRRRQTAR